MTDESADKAWVTIDVPLAAERLWELCRDPERLFRVNPLLEFERWSWDGPARLHAAGKNLGNGRPFTFEATVEREPDGWLLRYDQGLKSATRLRVEAAENGSRLVIEDDYSGSSPEEREARLDEVDRTLLPWAAALRRHLCSWRRWSWCGPWRWYVQRVWLPMKPAARRITGMVVWIGMAEFVAFLGILALYLVPTN